MSISAKDVQALRQRTGLGMMECKKALAQTHGDADAAIALLREKLKGKMDERTGRAAAEGIVAMATADDGSVAMVELNTETDFVARGEQFIEAGRSAAEVALQAPAGDVQADERITALIDDLRISTKENVSFSRGIKVEAAAGRIGTYLHHNNKIGALIVVDGTVDDETLAGLAQHIAALDGSMMPIPMAIDEAGLPQDQLDAKRQELVAEAEASGKPAEIAEKMSTGKLNKWKQECTLVGQSYVKDMTGKATIADILKGATIKQYVRYQVGVKDGE